MVFVNVFFDEFVVYLEFIIVCCENFVIVGDFNFYRGDLFDYDVMKFIELLEIFGFENYVIFLIYI